MHTNIILVNFLDDEGLRAAAQLIMPTIPPMYRAPLSNQMPDFIVVSRIVLAAGAGGILAAGMWNYNWKWSSESSVKAWYNTRIHGQSALNNSDLMIFVCKPLSRRTEGTVVEVCRGPRFNTAPGK